MRFKNICAAALIGASLLPMAEARAEWSDSIQYKAEFGVTLSDGAQTPLWLNANRFGFSSLERNNLWLRVGAFKYEDRSKRFTWGAGVDLGVAHRLQSTFMPQQLYAEVKYRCLDAMLGAKEIYDTMLDKELSSGALTNGWNSHPIPQLRVGIFDYADFWGTDGWFGVKGHIAYGVFTDNWWIKRWVNKETQYTLSTLYCSRAISFKGGDEKRFPLTGEFGLNMDTEFGGKTWMPDGNGGGHWDKHPVYAKAWLKALIPSKGGSDTAYGEQVNVEGNFLGNWNFALQWSDPRGWGVKLYYQHFFEDHSMMFFDYTWKDGLYGVQGKLPANPIVSDVVYEFLYTKDQSGPVYWDHTPTIDYQVSGRDNYYNHYIYNGWQHWGQGIGNPLLTSPVYNADHALRFRSTRVISHHVGFKGTPSANVGYRVLLSHTRSWGSYGDPFPHTKDNFSWLAEVKYHHRKLRGWEASVSLAGDHGHLLGNSFGGMLTISKTGWLK